MATIDRKVRVMLVSLSAFLLLPIALIPWVNTDKRETWERRPLATAPDPQAFMDDPKQYFQGIQAYFSDHIWGGLETIRTRRRIHYYVLGETGDRYVARSPDGGLFLIAPMISATRDRPYQEWKQLCLKLQNPANRPGLVAALRKAEMLLGSSGAEVIFANVPTTSVISADRPPRSAPDHLVKRCSRLQARRNHIAHIEESNGDLQLFYPLGLFRSKMTDPLFYPKLSYHWAGESTWVYAYAFARKFGFAVPRDWPESECHMRKTEWDFGRVLGLGNTTWSCNRKLTGPLVGRAARTDTITTEEGDFEVSMFEYLNPAAVNPVKVLMLSNSFGAGIAKPYSRLFQSLVHINLNRAPRGKIGDIWPNSELLQVDYVIVLSPDVHFFKLLDRLYE